jgi:hypothetical protein
MHDERLLNQVKVLDAVNIFTCRGEGQMFAPLLFKK